ncbi:unnamed protein product, partial [Amoebophrya sp. A25]
VEEPHSAGGGDLLREGSVQAPPQSSAEEEEQVGSSRFAVEEEQEPSRFAVEAEDVAEPSSIFELEEVERQEGDDIVAEVDGEAMIIVEEENEKMTWFRDEKDSEEKMKNPFREDMQKDLADFFSA